MHLSFVAIITGKLTFMDEGFSHCKMNCKSLYLYNYLLTKENLKMIPFCLKINSITSILRYAENVDSYATNAQ